MDKNSKLSKVHNVKAEIIIHCLDFLDKKKDEDKDQAVRKLSEYAKFYRVSLRKRNDSPSVKLHLRKFILNKEGYIQTLNPLYNSLLNS